MWSNSGDNRSRATSAMALIHRNGWSRGTRSSKSAMVRRLRWGWGDRVSGAPGCQGEPIPIAPVFQQLGPRALLCALSIRS